MTAIETAPADSDVEVPAGDRTFDRWDEVLHDGLRELLPPTLVASSSAARENTEWMRSARTGAQHTLGLLARDSEASYAAALGSTSVELLADTLVNWLRHRLADKPRWLMSPRARSTAPSKLATLTDFSTHRSRYVREVEGGASIFLTRRGQVVAALVPVTPGSFEEEAYRPVFQELLESAERQPSTVLTERDVERVRVEGASAGEEFGIDVSTWPHLNPASNENP